MINHKRFGLITGAGGLPGCCRRNAPVRKQLKGIKGSVDIESLTGDFNAVYIQIHAVGAGNPTA
jgi:hypothetical protein